MRLDDERESLNVEDRRYETNSSSGGMLNLLFSMLGVKGGFLALVVIFITSKIFDINLMPMLTGNKPQANSAHQKASKKDENLNIFSRKVLSTTERIWTAYFQQQGKIYRPPKMVLYRGSTHTACGKGQSIMGPFYCPADEKIYLDLSFYDDMKNQYKAGGDFAFAYVIAHEVGHHVQNLMGISRKTQIAQRLVSKVEANRISVRVELQADCFAGVWGYYINHEGRLDDDDIKEAFNAAEAIGDDRLQQQNRGHVVPDSFTHGSSAQRLQWFKKGLQSGDPRQCNTI